MATLVFTAIGSAIGGPLGGAIGGLVGREIDAGLFGGPGRQGPRLTDLKLTTSSYGTAIPRHFGAMRVPGTLIWATDMVEHSDTQSGGKGSPSVTTYSYSISMAIALSSRPFLGIGRIWADGTLLRGAEGDLKTGGQIRFYSGHGDHAPDPLIASAEGIYCPAFRGTAHVVFEDLDLSPYGNRIPALNFEVIADDEPLTLSTMLHGAIATDHITRPLPGLAGFSHEGGALGDLAATLDSLYPLACNAGGQPLRITDADAQPDSVPELPPAAITAEDGGYGQFDGVMRQRRTREQGVPTALRYFDRDRDYLTGLQRADGRARPGHERTLEFPGTLNAAEARLRINHAATRAGWIRETMSWRAVELDPALGPGSVVRAPGYAGLWRITGWEWRDHGVELELARLPYGPARAQAADPGRAQLPADLPLGTTELAACELPWDGNGTGEIPRLYAALSSASAGWRGAQVFAVQDSGLIPLGTGNHRAVLGESLTTLPSSAAHMLDRTASVTVRLVASDLALFSATPESLATGANTMLIGGELLQFTQATTLGNREWRLDGLLRGRGGTESAARHGQTSGSRVILIDHRLTTLNPAPASLPAMAQIAALGLADSAPVLAPIANRGLTQRPLTPVHPHISHLPDGTMILRWTRRARGALAWADHVDTPLNEESEAYTVGLGPVDAPILRWETGTPALTLDAPGAAVLAANHPDQPIWVRQLGRFAQSDPLLLTTLA